MLHLCTNNRPTIEQRNVAQSISSIYDSIIDQNSISYRFLHKHRHDSKSSNSRKSASIVAVDDLLKAFEVSIDDVFTDQTICRDAMMILHVQCYVVVYMDIRMVVSCFD